MAIQTPRSRFFAAAWVVCALGCGDGDSGGTNPGDANSNGSVPVVGTPGSAAGGPLAGAPGSEMAPVTGAGPTPGVAPMAPATGSPDMGGMDGPSAAGPGVPDGPAPVDPAPVDPPVGEPDPNEPDPADPAPVDPPVGEPDPNEPDPADPAPVDPAVGEPDPLPAGLVTLSPQEAYDVMQDPPEGLVVVDVRTEREFNQGHLEGAILRDFYGPAFTDELDGLDRDTPYVLYCSHGIRSGSTLGTMRDLGFKWVYEVAGGYTAWVRAGLPTVN